MVTRKQVDEVLAAQVRRTQIMDGHTENCCADGAPTGCDCGFAAHFDAHIDMLAMGGALREAMALLSKWHNEDDCADCRRGRPCDAEAALRTWEGAVDG